MANLVIATLRGGLNNVDPPIALPDDQVVVSENIDYERSTLGGRRRGQAVIDLSGSPLNSTVVFLHRHLPTVDEAASTFWGVSVSGTTAVFAYKDTTWHTVTPTNALAVASGQYAIRGLTLHGKLFFAYPLVSNVDRLMVYDGLTLRKTGLVEPAVPVVTDSGSGTFATTRYYRVRIVRQDPNGNYLSQSEPSETVTFTPSGTGQGALITKPAATGEGETAWAVEESINNADFYIIAFQLVSVTTWFDTNDPDQVTSGDFTLAPPIGSYSLQYSPKLVLADQDRAVMMGSWQQPALGSRVSWTPVYAAPGRGNDERLDENQDPFVDLDGYDGGAITDGGGPVNGYLYGFKLQRIFKLIRTGNVKQAYQAIKVTSAAGALPRSVVPGVDEQGRECLYFLDPEQGPKRIGSNGLESCGEDIQGTWATVNKNALLVSHGVFYPKRRQMHWWVALNGATTPNTRVVVYVKSFAPSVSGVRRGWSIWTGVRQNALASVLYADNIDANTTRSLALVPYTATSGALLISKEDTGTTDNGTLYRSYWRSKPYLMAQMLQYGGIRAASLMATAASGVSVVVKLIRDYGLETQTVTVSLTPQGSEDHVIVALDNSALSHLQAVQIEAGDAAAIDADWSLDMVAARIRTEETD